MEYRLRHYFFHPCGTPEATPQRAHFFQTTYPRLFHKDLAQNDGFWEIDLVRFFVYVPDCEHAHSDHTIVCLLIKLKFGSQKSHNTCLVIINRWPKPPLMITTSFSAVIYLCCNYLFTFIADGFHTT
jgi:hypothetical protein